MSRGMAFNGFARDEWLPESGSKAKGPCTVSVSNGYIRTFDLLKAYIPNVHISPSGLKSVLLGSLQPQMTCSSLIP